MMFAFSRIMELPRPPGRDMVAWNADISGRLVLFFVPKNVDPADEAADVVVQGTVMVLEHWSTGAPRAVIDKEGRDQPVMQTCTSTPVLTRQGRPIIQTLGDGFLLASSRCPWRNGVPKCNGEVFDVSGSLRQSLLLGDGVADVVVTADGTIGVGYFDEGVFGNLGWGGPGPEPLGSAGLMAYAADGSGCVPFCPPPGFGAPADVYALTASGSALWAYYYTDFCIVRWEPGSTAIAATVPVQGARALAVVGSRFALLGSYDDPSAITFGRLTTGGAVDVQHERVTYPGDCDPRSIVVGRAGQFHLVTGSEWWCLDLRDELSRGSK